MGDPLNKLFIAAVGFTIGIALIMFSIRTYGDEILHPHKKIETAVSDYMDESVRYDFQSLDGYYVMKSESGKRYSIIWDDEEEKILKSQELSKEEYVLYKESDEEKRANSSSDTVFIPIITGR